MTRDLGLGTRDETMRRMSEHEFIHWVALYRIEGREREAELEKNKSKPKPGRRRR